VNEWIKCSDRVPEGKREVMAYTNKDGILFGMYLDRTQPIGEWVSKYFKWSGDYVTHWMPLPDPPKEAT